MQPLQPRFERFPVGLNRGILMDSQSLGNERIWRIDSLTGGPMPKLYSQDLRMRVVEAVEGGASRREVAELYGISPSVVVIWMQRWNDTGNLEAKPSGGSVSPLDQHQHFLLGLIGERPDMTLDEIVAAMARVGIEGSRTAVWRFFERHGISFKKKLCMRPNRSAPM